MESSSAPLVMELQQDDLPVEYQVQSEIVLSDKEKLIF